MANVFQKLTTYFKGRDDMKEEVKEAKAVKAGKITPKQYAKGEKSEGEKAPAKKLVQTAKKIQSGKMTPTQYAKGQKSETKKKAK